MRIMVAPGVWQDMGPQTARSLSNYGTPVGSMVPFLHHGGENRDGKTGEKPPRAVCGQTLKRSGEACARKPGHANFHISREALDHDAAHRRAKRPSRAA